MTKRGLQIKLLLRLGSLQNLLYNSHCIIWTLLVERFPFLCMPKMIIFLRTTFSKEEHLYTIKYSSVIVKIWKRQSHPAWTIYKHTVRIGGIYTGTFTNIFTIRSCIVFLRTHQKLIIFKAKWHVITLNEHKTCIRIAHFAVLTFYTINVTLAKQNM